MFCRSFCAILMQKTLSQPTKPIMAYTIAVRSISSLEITKNITLLSGKKKDTRVVNLKLQNEEDKPLVVMLSWLMAKKKHIFKYADFYIKRGYDVMNVNITPWQLLWPLKGTQLIAADIVQFLHLNKSCSPILVHAFSVGGYVWSEALVQIAADQSRYQHVLDRFIGQIGDSLADITEIPTGLPYAVFPENQFLQTIFRKYIIYHMKTFDKVATCHYVRASQMFHTSIIKAPALILVSKTDPIGSEVSNMRLKENWESMGIPVSWKCWDKSPHVGHFRHHPEEYVRELTKFLDTLGMEKEKQEFQQESKRLKANL